MQDVEQKEKVLEIIDEQLQEIKETWEVTPQEFQDTRLKLRGERDALNSLRQRIKAEL